jgi:hypothetical protein
MPPVRFAPDHEAGNVLHEQHRHTALAAHLMKRAAFSALEKQMPLLARMPTGMPARCKSRDDRRPIERLEFVKPAASINCAITSRASYCLR